MPDSRSMSLLDFAIAASLAVVPLLLAVLLGMGTIVQRSSFDGDRHVSVRQVAALKTFEHAIVRRDTVQDPSPTASGVIAQVPECSAEWSGHDDALRPLARLFGAADDEARTPAHRLAAQLVELDEALARMTAGGNRRVSHAVGFDLARWAVAARSALATPAQTPQYPGRSFNVRCSDLASAAAMISRGRGRMLGALAWRGTAVDRAIAHWRPDQYVEISTRHLARGNPWAGIPGCVYLASVTSEGHPTAPAYFVKMSRATHERICKQHAVAGAPGERRGVDAAAIAGEAGPDVAPDDLRWHVPPSLGALLQPLETVQQPSGALYRSLSAREDAARSNRASVDGTTVDMGFSVDLTIDPMLQALAQKVAACYTGRQDVCRASGVRRAEDGANPIGHRLLERAVVRMAAIAIVDVESGRIEALAGALSPCTRQEYDGPGREAECDARLPYPIRYKPDALLNPAVFHDAMPASVVKPIMAAAFLSNADVGTRWLTAERTAMRSPSPPAAESLRGHLMRSNSARFLDRMFCSDRDFAKCERPWEVRNVAAEFGWNGGCVQASEHCGTFDLLFGRSRASTADPSGLDAPVAWVPYGRLMVEPAGTKIGAPFRTRAAVALDTARIRRCAAGADGRRISDDDWEKCSGGMIVDVVAEGWGQGHARSTALGAAGMMATLASAANGRSEVSNPHLVRGIRGVAGSASSAIDSAVTRWTASATRPHALSQEAAAVILSGLSYSHRQGTARRACEQVFDARTCREIDWIAGKTGTPTFPNDERSLDELAKLCAPGVKRTSSEQSACGGLRPYKWYVAAYRTGRDPPAWTKVIGVLTERNWLADSGRVHGAGDHGPNPAAEIAFQIAGRHAGMLAGDVR